MALISHDPVRLAPEARGVLFFYIDRRHVLAKQFTMSVSSPRPHKRETIRAR